MKTKMRFVDFNLRCLLCILAACMTVGCDSAVEVPAKVDVGTVSLVVDFPEDAQQVDQDLQVGCTADSTVFDVLQRAEKDGLKVDHTINVVQESTSIFVHGFNGLSEAKGKFWTFYVNGELAKKSCGACLVKPDDKIRWVYGKPPAELE